ncbi:MAG: diguanylate cyclase, partial [Gammaproteobacteria bacterium]|nr:diguanylate cyclase [Gammaproteobacteria bacterium]
MKKIVYQFASDEVEAALLILNKAISHHRLWFDNLHTSIVCGLPFSKDILHDAAHKHCEFGKWYYGDVCESVRSISEFSAIEPVHAYMHSHARDLAIISSQNKKISVDDYHSFLKNQRHLIDLLTKLRDTLTEHEHCFDGVTGAVNRKSVSLLLEQTFENAKRYNQVYSVAMLDIDHFKKIND